MEAKDLQRIIWPTSVDMMGQVVAAMAFFFLLMFIVLAYFLKQIELRQRLTTDEQHYQYLYEPFREQLGRTEIKKKEQSRPNIDELIVQIQDYILSAPPSRVKELKSLIAKRNKLVDELYQLGYTGYSKTNPLSGNYAIMPLATLESLKRQGRWRILPQSNRLIIRFEDNSVVPDRNSAELLSTEVARFVRSNPGGKVILKSYLSERLVVNNLTQWLALHRTITLRNQLRANGVDKSLISFVNNIVDNQRFPYGAIELSYE